MPIRVASLSMNLKIITIQHGNAIESRKTRSSRVYSQYKDIDRKKKESFKVSIIVEKVALAIVRPHGRVDFFFDGGMGDRLATDIAEMSEIDISLGTMRGGR